MAEGFSFLFSGMQIWPRRMEPTLPEKGFQAREGNSARTPKYSPAKKRLPDSTRRTVTRAPIRPDEMH